MPSLPGHELEKAAAEVGSAAGKSLVSGLDRLFQSWIARRASRNEAVADETKKEISHQGERRRLAESIQDRRHQELREVEHRYELQQRVAGRLLAQWEAEQKAVEWVASKAVQLTERDPERDQERELDDDWLRRFFKYVAEVDERQVLEVLAQALSDASIRSKPLISPRALDTLRFFERDTLDMFRFAAVETGMFDMVPQHFLRRRAEEKGRDFDLGLMVEMGLLKSERNQTLFVPIGDLRLRFSTGVGGNYDFEAIRLTQVGKSIAGLLEAPLKPLLAAFGGTERLVDVWEMQRKAGIEQGAVRKLATQIVSEIYAVDNLDIAALVTSGPMPELVFDCRRKRALLDPFRLGGLSTVDGLAEDNRAAVAEFVDVFEDFDDNTLPTITEIDGSAPTF